MGKIIRPSWPLGLRFIDSKRREFEVVTVTMGNPGCLGYEVEMLNGWMVKSQFGEHPQTAAGFVDVSNRTRIINESVENLDRFLKTGHLKIIGNEII